MKYAQDSFAIDQKFTIDPKTGFLHLPLIPSKVGILQYPEERRFLSAEVLKAALDSLDYVPITKDHEGCLDGDLVTTENIDKVNRGIVKAGSTFDGKKIHSDGLIQNPELIDDLLSKKVIEASAGYSYDDDKKPGKNEYGEFDTSYTWIKYNHVTAVSKFYKGRAGADVKFEIDQKEGKNMGKIKQKLPAFKVGADTLFNETAIMFTEDCQTAFDACAEREQKLIDKVQSQNTEIETLKASNAANKESLDTLKAAQDGLIKKEDLNELTAELLDARQIAVKVGLDCKDEIDPLIIKQKVLEKMLPNAYKDLKTRKSLSNKAAVDSAYMAFKENMSFHQEVHNTQQALQGQQGAPAPKPRPNLLNSFARFPR